MEWRKSVNDKSVSKRHMLTLVSAMNTDVAPNLEGCGLLA